MSESYRTGPDLNRVRTGRDCLIRACMLSPLASLTSYEVEIPHVADRKTPPKSSNDRGERQTSSRRTFNESIDYGEGKRGGFEMSPTRPSPAQKLDRGQGKTKGRTMTVDDERHGLACHLQRWMHYNRARERFFEAWSNTFSVLSVLAGTSVVVALLEKSADWAPLVAGTTVASMQALEQVLRLGERWRG